MSLYFSYFHRFWIWHIYRLFIVPNLKSIHAVFAMLWPFQWMLVPPVFQQAEVLLNFFWWVYITGENSRVKFRCMGTTKPILTKSEMLRCYVHISICLFDTTWGFLLWIRDDNTTAIAGSSGSIPCDQATCHCTNAQPRPNFVRQDQVRPRQVVTHLLARSTAYCPRTL